MDRIDQLAKFIEQRPDDPFPRYGLALEYANQGRLDEAREAFEALADRFPDYVATYLMAGNTLARLERKDDAIAMYRRGIEVATRAGDHHTKSELETALAELDDAGV